MRTATVALLATVLLTGCGGQGEVSSAAPASSGITDEDRQRTALDACEAQVVDELKAPATAVFPDMDAVYFEVSSTTRVAVASYVDSENSYGALIRTEWSCSVQLYGDGRLRDVRLSFAES